MNPSKESVLLLASASLFLPGAVSLSAMPARAGNSTATSHRLSYRLAEVARLSVAQSRRTRRATRRSSTYRPPSTARIPRGPAIPGGRRGGCAMPANLGLTALAPQQHIGLTQSLQPMLAWFVPSTVPYGTTLQLYEYVEDSWTLISEQSLGQSHYGYTSYTLPTPLNVSSLYRWNVILSCDPSRPSSDRVAGAQFEIVSPPVGSAPTQTDALQQASRYAASGLWYDAVATLSTTEATTDQTAYLSDLLLSLSATEEADVEAASPQASPLQQIAEILSQQTSLAPSISNPTPLK